MADNKVNRVITPYSLPLGNDVSVIDRKVGLRNEEVEAQRKQNIGAGIGAYLVCQSVVLVGAIMQYALTDEVSLRGVGVFSAVSLTVGMAFAGILFAIRGSRDEFQLVQERNQLIEQAARAELRADRAEQALHVEQQTSKQLRDDLRLAVKDVNRDNKWVGATTESQAVLEDAKVLYLALLHGKGSRESMRDASNGVAWGQRRWEAARDVLVNAGVLWYDKGKPKWVDDERQGMLALSDAKLRGLQAQASNVRKVADDDEDA